MKKLLLFCLTISCLSMRAMEDLATAKDFLTFKPLLDNIAETNLTALDEETGMVTVRTLAPRCFIIGRRSTTSSEGKIELNHAETIQAAFEADLANRQNWHDAEFYLFYCNANTGSLQFIRTINANDPMPEKLSPYWNKALFKRNYESLSKLTGKNR